MVTGRVHLPDDIIETEREPGERDPVAISTVLNIHRICGT